MGPENGVEELHKNKGFQNIKASYEAVALVGRRQLKTRKAPLCDSIQRDGTYREREREMLCLVSQSVCLPEPTRPPTERSSVGGKR